MQADKRIYKTADGELVPEGDPRAATLAYSEGDEVRPEDEDKVSRMADSSEGQDGDDQDADDQQSTVKRVETAEDKAAKRGGDKSK